MDEPTSNNQPPRRKATQPRNYSFAAVYDGPPPPYPVQTAEVLDSGCSLRDLATTLRSQRSPEGRTTDAVSPERSSPSFASSSDDVSRFDASANDGSSSQVERANSAELQSDFGFVGSHSNSFRTHPDNSNGVFRSSPEQTFADPGPSTRNHRRKGECYLCSRISRLHEKETCLVCKAKFCNMCVLKAMGSMPEGRKCVGCIGEPIDESKRPDLGKPSRLLNRLLSRLEVQHIMKAERECPCNQLCPKQVCVNGNKLCAEELAELLGCSNPPLKLKPGKYWYDKQSGYWGKEGEKPEKIIAAELNIGGELQEKASAGCAEVFINGREITKTELKMLKFAGVECQRGTRLWVYKDGSYQEEGQRMSSGNIWGKGTTKFVYSLFLLPTPKCNKVGDSVGPGLSVPAYLQQNRAYKVLLLGHEGSGTSTIFNQAKFLSRDAGFTQEELQNVVLRIQSNVYKYISILLDARERFEDEEEAVKASGDEPENLQVESGESVGYFIPQKGNPYAMDARLKVHADWILENVVTGQANFRAFFQEAAPFVEELWKDTAIQATYKRKAELHMLPDVAEYFLDKVIDVSSNDYCPTNEDILYAEGVTQGTGLVELEFSLDESLVSEMYDEDADPELVRYHLIRINAGGMTEGCKWLDMFEDVQAVIFCVGLDAYGQMWTDGSAPLQNKMLVARELFENVVKHSCFHDTSFVLLLNRYDAFEEKVQSVPLTTCEWFSDYHPVQTSRHNPAQQAYTYIAYKFKKHYEHISAFSRKLYTFQLIAWDRSAVSAAFQYVHEILKWEGNKSNHWNINDETIYSSEPSSFSQLLQNRYL